MDSVAEEYSEVKLRNRLHAAARYTNAAVALTAVLVLLGWQFDIAAFKSVLPGLPAMNPATTVCFLLTSVAFYLLIFRGTTASAKKSGKIAALFLLALALVKIFTLVLGLEHSIDTVLFSSKLGSGATMNRMAPNTAVCFICTAVSLLFFEYETKEKRSPAQFFSVFVFLMAFLCLLGYTYKVSSFSGVLNYMPMALHTSCCFILVSCSILFAGNRRGFMSELTSRYSGGTVSRILIPAAIAIPSVLGFLRLYFVWQGMFSSELGTALLVVSTITIFLLVIFLLTRLLNEKDRNRREAESKLEKWNIELEWKVMERTEAIEKSERRFRALIENNYDSIILSDATGALIYQSPSTERLLGWTQEERKQLNGFSIIHPEDAERVKKIFSEVLANPGKLFRSTHRLKCKSGNYIWAEGIYINMLNDTAIGAIVANFHDITERRLAEEKILSLNEGLEQKVIDRTAQLEAVNKELESFSYSVSHDLRAPLRAVTGYAGILVEDYGAKLDEEGMRILNTISHNAEKMGKLIDDLLAFSRMGRKEIQKQEENMNELVEGVLIEINKTMKHNAAISINHLHSIRTDYGLMNHVMMNLLSNAIKYSSKREQPLIEISSVKSGNEVIFSVSDNGAGFNMKYADKLFGVFQRLHSSDEFEGTGVGLAIVQRIISKHNGRVWAEGKPGEGAVFYFSIPVED